MSYLGTFHIDDYVGIPAATHRFSSGAAYAPSALTYSIYEEATTTGLDEDVDMTPASPFDSITGCYWVRRQLTAAAGFEAGKNYLVVVKATVDSVAAIQMHTFQVEASSVAQTGDAYAIVNHADYGNAKLVRSTTPANTLTVDSNGAIISASITGGLSSSALNEISIKSASGVWNNESRVITGGSVVATSGSVVATNVLDKTNYSLSTSGLGEIGIKTASSVWTETSRTITGGSITGGSVIAVSVLDKTNYSLSSSGLVEVSSKAASGVWNNSTRIVTGGSVVATSGSVVTTSNLDKTNYSLSASGLNEVSVKSASGVWNNGTRNLTDKIGYGLSGSALTEISSSVATPQEVWEYSGSRWITGGSVIATSGSVTVVSNTDKLNYGLSGSALVEISAKAASGVWNNTTRTVTGGSVSATSGSVVAITVDDKTGYSIAASGIGSTAIGASAINDQSITDVTRNEISKNLLKFDISTITGEASRSVLNAIRFLRNKWSISGTTLTVTKENDTDTAWQAEVSSTESADPITGIDPG